MDEIDFVHRGKRMHLTRQQVIDAMRHQQPAERRKWMMDVSEISFPVCQIYCRATGIAADECNTHAARGTLLRLGFRDSAS